MEKKKKDKQQNKNTRGKKKQRASFNERKCHHGKFDLLVNNNHYLY
jgi:hypothetical protein